MGTMGTCLVIYCGVLWAVVVVRPVFLFRSFFGPLCSFDFCYDPNVQTGSVRSSSLSEWTASTNEFALWGHLSSPLTYVCSRSLVMSSWRLGCALPIGALGADRFNQRIRLLQYRLLLDDHVHCHVRCCCWLGTSEVWSQPMDLSLRRPGALCFYDFFVGHIRPRRAPII